MPTISVTIIAHNEEEKLPRALKSSAWADEIIVVDCGSSDRTSRWTRPLSSGSPSSPEATCAKPIWAVRCRAISQ